MIGWIGWIGFAICAIGWRVTFVNMASYRFRYFRKLSEFDDLAGVETPHDRWNPEPKIRID